MAKTSDKTNQPGRLKRLLTKRVDVTPKNNRLGKDVRAPKPLRAIGEYFKGAYQELRQVKWPTRKASWALTLAVIVFTSVMVAFILALDYGFDVLFKKVIL